MKPYHIISYHVVYYRLAALPRGVRRAPGRGRRGDARPAKNNNHKNTTITIHYA